MQQSHALLIKSQKPIPNSEIKTYGFGLELDGRLGRVAQYHSGSTLAYHSHTNRFPKEKLSVFVMSNNGNIWSGSIADEIASILLPEIEVKKEESYDSRFYESVNDNDKPQILGQYISSSGYLTRIVREEGKTYLRQGNTVNIEIILVNNNIYAADYDPKLKIVFYKDEMVLFYPSGKTSIFERGPDLSASFADVEGFVGTYESSELEMSFALRLTEKNKLKILFSNRKREREVELLNRNELLASNFVLKVERDQFDRVTDILVTLNDRAENNRFRKKTNLKFQPKIETENGSIQVRKQKVVI